MANWSMFLRGFCIQEVDRNDIEGQVSTNKLVKSSLQIIVLYSWNFIINLSWH